MACHPLDASSSGLPSPSFLESPESAVCAIVRGCERLAPEGIPCFAAPWVFACLALRPVLALMMWNTRYQFRYYGRMRRENRWMTSYSLSPLWMTEHWFRGTQTRRYIFYRLLCWGWQSGSDITSWRAWMISQACMPTFLLEFGALALYKQIVCISTRLTPATQSDNVRINSLGISMSTWIDYGISGHTGLTVLLWLHLRTWPSLFFAIVQTVLMCITREHYTLDVLHAWVFSFAIFGAFDAIVLS